MLSPRLFWLISLFLIGYSTIVGFTLKIFLPLGILGALLLYGSVIGFIGFLLGQKWGYALTLVIQLIFLAAYIFPSILVIEFVLQAIGIGIIFMAKPYFQNR